MDRFRKHLTFANVVSLTALFVALGGTATAAVIITSNSQVARDTISGHQPPSGDHSNIITSSLTGKDIANKGLTSADIAGKVANADLLDGIDSTEFIHGQGRIETIDTATATSAILFVLPGFVRVDGACGGTSSPGEASIQTSDLPVDVLSENGGADPVHSRIPANSVAHSGNWFLEPNAGSLTFSFESGGQVATVFLFSYAFHNPVLNQDVCQFQGHVIVNGA